jgi:hypothetical protein
MRGSEKFRAPCGVLDDTSRSQRSRAVLATGRARGGSPSGHHQDPGAD